MQILITTSGRPNKQATLNSIPACWLPKVSLVIQYNEQSLYEPFNVNKIVLPPAVVRLSPTRAYLAQEGVITDGSFILADDDIKFSRRKGNSLIRCTEDDMCVLLDKLEENLLIYDHVGVSQRFLNRDPNCDHIVGTKALWFVGYDTKAYRNLEHDRLEVMSDVDYTLQLFKKGQPNLVLYDFAMDQVSQAGGGCSVYRDYYMMERNAKMLQKFHPGVVTAYRSQSKKGGYCADQDGYVWRTKIRWREALKNG